MALGELEVFRTDESAQVIPDNRFSTSLSSSASKSYVRSEKVQESILQEKT
jgi:hypothetical protein